MMASPCCSLAFLAAVVHNSATSTGPESGKNNSCEKRRIGVVWTTPYLIVAITHLTNVSGLEDRVRGVFMFFGGEAIVAGFM